MLASVHLKRRRRNVPHHSPSLPLSTHIRAHRLVALAALLAVLATSALVLVLAIGDGSSPTSSVSQPQAAVRADGGPEETGVAAAIRSQATAVAADESKIAAAIGSGREAAPAATRPDESSIAAAISGD